MSEKLLKTALILLLFCSAALFAHAEEPPTRPVTSVYAIEAGGTDALSTYLSPLKYSGSAWGALGEWSKAMPFDSEHAIMTFEGGARFRNMHNPPHTAQMLGLHAGFSWGMAYRHRLPYDIMLAAGGAVDIGGGALYLPRNGNNPVAADASAAISLTARASWHFNIGRLPVLLSDRVRLPSLGVFFSPEYGETYYEIYLGNHSGLAHCGWWGNRFHIDNLLSVDLDFGRTAMRIGYRYTCESSYVCHINTRINTHSIVIGVIPGGLGLKKPKPGAVNALYY